MLRFATYCICEYKQWPRGYTYDTGFVHINSPGIVESVSTKWALLKLKNQFGCKKKEKGSKRGKNMRERERERERENV